MKFRTGRSSRNASFGYTWPYDIRVFEHARRIHGSDMCQRDYSVGHGDHANDLWMA